MYHFATQAEETAYRTAITTNDRPYDTVEGIVTFVDETIDPLTIDSSIMPTNAIKISQQCIDGEELMFGGVFTGELNIQLFTDVDRYAFFGAKITLEYKIKIGETEEEEPEPIYATVPLGEFTIADADRPKQDLIKITAYDNMTMLDGSIGGNLINGTPWQVFSRIATDTGIELAFEQGWLESNFVNTDYQIEASEEHGIKTYRDVVKMVCQQMACFAYADRYGRLAVREFSTTPDLTLGDNTTGVYPWYTFVPADYISKYIGLSVTSASGTYQSMTSDPTEQGLVMTIEDGPAWDLGSEARLQDQTAEVFTVLHGIQYTPSTLDMPSDATFDCGDMIALNVRGGDTIITLITSFEWQFHKGMKVTSEGANPLISENLIDSGNRILNQAIAKSKLQFVHFTNPSEVTITDASLEVPVKIAEAEFTPTGSTDALMVATILVDVDIDDISITETEDVSVPVKAYKEGDVETTLKDPDGNVVSLTGVATNTYTYERDGKCDISIFYKLDGLRLPNELHPYIAVEEIEGGQHIITVVYPLTGLIEWNRYTFEIYMTTDEGTITIPATSIRASIFGQEIDIVNRFEGVIKVDENFDVYPYFKNIGVLDIDEEGEVTLIFNHFIRVSDDISLYNIDSLEVLPIAEGTGALAPQIYLRSGFHLVSEDGRWFTSEDGKHFITE